MSAPARHRHRAWYPYLGAAALGILAWAVGLSVPHATLLTGAAVALTLVTSVLGFGDRSTWPVLPYGRRDGARRDVSGLTWTMLNRGGGLSEAGARRLHLALTESLRLEGTGATSARASDLFGPHVARWLAEPPGPHNPTAPPDRATARRAMSTAATLLRTPPTRKGSHVHPR
ncbi:hypothetical protein [Ruania halotolerans]|uniref:hypothetical protein n=1 Tax=Ruania halotolerans TaxID=2897773 RepID=UPI001E5481F2|nr:hypothetical protein [Ruania halotolerans]UFU05549.1 hypothetical protein LQF10_13985 [Ruania halotolerans]